MAQDFKIHQPMTPVNTGIFMSHVGHPVYAVTHQRSVWLEGQEEMFSSISCYYVWRYCPSDKGEDFMKSLFRLNPEQMTHSPGQSFSLCLKCVLEAFFTVFLIIPWQCLSFPENGWSRYQFSDTNTRGTSTTSWYAFLLWTSPYSLLLSPKSDKPKKSPPLFFNRKRESLPVCVFKS